MPRDRSSLRGESARVADRVRAVLDGSVDAPPVDGGLDRPGGRLAMRLDPGRRAVVGIGVVVVLAAVITGVWVLSSRPRSMPVSDASLASASPLVGSSGAARSARSSAPVSSAMSSAGLVVVDVAGKVLRPGVYRLPPGSRVDDALKAAGGARGGVDLTSLNLAAVLVDGQQIAVGRPGAVASGGAPASGGAASPSGGSGGGSGGPGGLVNLNNATLDQLEALPGIGPALGQRILDYRTEHGSFASVDQLDDVSGIGTVIFARLKPLVTV